MAFEKDDLFIQIQRELKDDPDDLNVPINKAALFLGCGKSTLDHLRLDGGGPRFRYIGNRVFYPLGELRRFAQSQLFNNTAEVKAYAEKIAQSYCLAHLPNLETHPFWIRNSTRRIIGSIFRSQVNFRHAFLSADIDVIWLPCRDALLAQWEDTTEFERMWRDLTKGANVLEVAKLKVDRIEHGSVLGQKLEGS